MQKPNPGEPATLVLADGREHALRFPLRVLKQLKAEHQIDMLGGGQSIAAAMSDPEKLAIILAAGFNDPVITAEWLEDNVELSHIQTAIAPMLVYAATGQWIGDGASPNGAASNGNGGSPSTGSDSGLKDATTSD